MIKLTDFSQSELSQYLSSYQETQLSIKIDINSNNDLPLLEIIEKQLGNISQLKGLSIKIPKNTILTEKGYHLLSNAVINLKQLQQLSLLIEDACYLEAGGLTILKKTINLLPQISYLKFKLGFNNYITAEAAQEFLDSITENNNLRTLKLYFEEIKSASPTINEGNIHFWRGLSKLTNIEKVVLCFNEHNYGNSDLIELFSSTPNLKTLRRLSLIIRNKYYVMSHLNELFSCVGQMLELRSLKTDITNNKNLIYILNDAQRKTIIRNLSNLKFLEKLRLNSFIGDLLFKHNFVEYADFIGDLKHLKRFAINQDRLGNPVEIQLLGKSIRELKNLSRFALIISLDQSDRLNEFYSDVLASFEQMPNLSSLQIEFRNYIEQDQCNILGEHFLNNLRSLEKLKLTIELSWSRDCQYNLLMHSIRNLTKLKDLEIQISLKYKGQVDLDFTDQDEEEVVLFESILHLNQLERLCLSGFSWEDSNIGIRNVQAFCCSLRNLGKLRQLECNLFINNLKNYEQLDMLEQGFEFLKNLEKLSLVLNIEIECDDVQNRSILKHLSNLKHLSIHFKAMTINVFEQLPHQLKLDFCQLSFKRKTDTETFIQILDSLSQSIITKLKIIVEFNVNLKYKEQFGLACSKFRNIKKLEIYDSQISETVFYATGLKEMKSLKSLTLNFDIEQLIDSDVLALSDSLKQLIHLKRLKLENEMRRGPIIGDALDRFQLSSLKLFENLKSFQFDMRLTVLENNRSNGKILRIVSFSKACTLDQEQFNPMILKQANNNQITEVTETNDIINEDFEEQKFNVMQQISNVENTQIHNSLNLTGLAIEISLVNQQKLLTLNQFDFHNTKYLNQLEIVFRKESYFQVELRQLEPLRDLKNESKLTKLILSTNGLIFNEELIMYFSRNFKYLTNLQYFKFYISFSSISSSESEQSYQDCFSTLFDSFKYMTNLHELYLNTTIYESGAISLGNSLKEMRKLCICELDFSQDSVFGCSGISSIFNGLSQTTQLRELSLKIISKQKVDQESQVQFSESFQNLQFLEKLKVVLGIENLDSSCLVKFMFSIGTVVSLKSLSLYVKEVNPFNQDMLDKLIQSINKLQFLQSQLIEIFLEKNKAIRLSEEFSNLFNKKLSKTLEITTTRNEVSLEQNHSSRNREIYFKFQSENTENLQLSFLKYLNERKLLEFYIEESKIMKNPIIFTARTIRLHFFREKQLCSEDIDNICQFISIGMTNTFEIIIEITMNSKINLDESVTKLAQSFLKLRTVKVLNFHINSNWEDIVHYEQLKLMLSFLKNMQWLQRLSLNANRYESRNKQIIPQIQRFILRQVQNPQ